MQMKNSKNKESENCGKKLGKQFKKLDIYGETINLTYQGEASF